MTVSAEPPMSQVEPASSNGAQDTGEAEADMVRPAAAGAPKRRVPDFFIVGHEKCGTTALYRMLRSHPQIYMPDLKEPRFFSPDLSGRGRGPRPAAGVRPHTLDDYLALFAAAGPEQRAGEASPQYIRSATAASAIADVQPAARIIAILREPASFLRSYHLQCVQSDLETEKDLRKALALEEPRRRGRHIPRRCEAPERLLYSDHVRYVEQLRRYHAVFPPEHVLVLIYEDLRRDNEASIRTVLRFLEVDETIPIEAIKTEPLKATRFVHLHQMTYAVRVAKNKPAMAGPVSRAVSTLLPRRVRGSALETAWRRIVYAEPRAPDEELMHDLRLRFKGEVVALSEYLGRDLVTLWGYEDIA
ncbi:MAG: sulfotransferase family protein [Solirubrobacterales bacterium]